MSLITAPITLLLLLGMSILIGRIAGRHKNPVCAMAVGGTILVAMSTGIMSALHCLGIPITTVILLPIYLGIAFVLVLMNLTTAEHLPWEISPDITKILLPGIALYLIVIFPYSHFTGIDTYKWQDLATAIRVEHNIPWLVHPISLFGFTPRSYPSAQPILLATIQIIGKAGVDAGFFVISMFVATLGCSAAYFLGLRAFANSRTASIFALLYIYTPVFTRYTHWATGRGLFMALFPLLLAILIGNQHSSTKNKNGFSGHSSIIVRTVAFIALPLLLALSHKAGFVIALACIPMLLVGLFVPRNSQRTTIIISMIPFIALALLIVTRKALPFPLGNLIGIIFYSLTRFGLLMPLAIMGLLYPRNLLAEIKWRGLYPLVLAAIPLAFERHMYGALFATPLITLAATQYIELIMGTKAVTWKFGGKQPTLFWGVFCILALSFTLATIIHRTLIATSPEVYRAAQFLEQYDPLGPFTITAPGRTRTQIQAYVSGCPRFNVSHTTNATIRIPPPPSIKGAPREILENWIAYMRGFISIPEASTDWYGKEPRQYYFTIGGKGSYSAHSTLIYNKDNIHIYLAEPKP